jgi:hypothetical protein
MDMETVFDIATPEELIELFGEDDPDLPEHLRGYALERESALDPDSNFQDLALLYAGRGDLKKADQCLDKISDQRLRLDCELFIYERRGDEGEPADTDSEEIVLYKA